MDMMRRPVVPEFVVDVSDVMTVKREMLARHQSQKAWLDATQGMDAYLESMAEVCREVGSGTAAARTPKAGGGTTTWGTARPISFPADAAGRRS
jgi:LmbE family N-acetylglucosaminyl deacetylase